MTTKRNFNTSARKKSDVPEGYAADPTAGNMLRFQASLPRLPVPALSSTVHKYLETIRPLLTDAEYAKSQATAQEFLKSPLAAQLQERLEARAADPSLNNWLADWWNDAAYMGYRDPVVVYVSYFYVHLDDPRRRDPAKRAASLIKAMLPFRELTESSVCCMSLVLFCH
jgi:carnitine O-acetyltransferase